MRSIKSLYSAISLKDIERLVMTTREGCRIAEAPVKWVHDSDTRIHHNLCRALRILGELFRIRRWRFKG